MGLDPQFASTVNNGAVLLGAAETNMQVPTTASVLVTAGATGTKVEEIVVQAAGTGTGVTTVAGVVYIFLYDGTIHSLYDTFAVTAVVSSATAPPFRLSKTYTNLFFRTGWSLRASQSIVGNANILKAHAFAGDY